MIKKMVLSFIGEGRVQLEVVLYRNWGAAIDIPHTPECNNGCINFQWITDQRTCRLLPKGWCGTRNFVSGKSTEMGGKTENDANIAWPQKKHATSTYLLWVVVAVVVVMILGVAEGNAVVPRSGAVHHIDVFDLFRVARDGRELGDQVRSRSNIPRTTCPLWRKSFVKKVVQSMFSF